MDITEFKKRLEEDKNIYAFALTDNNKYKKYSLYYFIEGVTDDNYIYIDKKFVEEIKKIKYRDFGFLKFEEKDGSLLFIKEESIEQIYPGNLSFINFNGEHCCDDVLSESLFSKENLEALYRKFCFEFKNDYIFTLEHVNQYEDLEYIKLYFLLTNTFES